jgi:cell division protein FtsI (penicillin-binding protein 3)
VAQALELGMVTPETIINTQSPMIWGRHRISDFRHYANEMSVSRVIEKSSNVGTARIAIDIGAERQRDFLGQLGLLETTKFEMVEARGGKPLLPPRWSELSTMTISYGHGMSATPLHLAAAYATMVNGGTKIEPTLLKQNGPQFGPRVISERTSEQLRRMLRLTVSQGTASFGDVPGYAVGGKTGSADKPRIDGRGYETDKVLATFAATFPAHDPKYVLIVTLDEAVETSGTEPRRTAGWTAVPVAAEVIRRVAPLLGLRPEIEPAELTGITLTSN